MGLGSYRERCVVLLATAALLTWSGCSCSGDGDDDPMGADGGEVIPAEPQLAGIALIYPSSSDTVHVHWAAATDDVTPAEEITYLVYQGDSVEAVTGAHDRGDAPVATVVGTTSYTASGLSPDQLVAFTLVAVDGDGNESTEADAQGIAALPRDPVVRVAPKDLRDETITEVGRDEFLVSGLLAPSLVAGDIVIIPYSIGRWLRRVETVANDPGGVRITTSQADLGDVFESAVFRSKATAIEVPDGTSLARDHGTTKGWARSFTDPGGTFHVEERGTTRPFTDARAHKSEGNVQLEVGVTYGYSAKFTPSYELETEINTASPDEERIHLNLSGKFEFEGRAGYFYEASASYKTKKELFSRAITLRYAVGGVPVVQDVRLSFFAELDFSSTAAFKVDSVLKATRDISIDVDYDPSSGWSMSSEDGFERTVEFTVDGHTTANANLKISAELATTFYKAAEMKVTVQPTLDLQAAARFSPLPLEMTKFDVLFWVDAWVDANLTILGKEIGKWRSDTYQLIKIPLYTLPELKLNANDLQLTTCHPRKLFLGLTHGYNNPVPAGNISWELLDAPSQANLNIVAPTSNLVAETSSDETAQYKVRVSAFGDGFLGALGTRYVTLDVTVDEPMSGTCDPAGPEFSMEDIFGCDDRGSMGLVVFPTLSKTKVSEGDKIELTWRDICPDCYLSVHFQRYDPGSSAQQCLFGNDQCDPIQRLSDGSDERKSELTYVSAAFPGIYYPRFAYNSQFLGGGTRTGYYATPEDGAGYKVGQYAPNPNSWSCDGGAGIPVPFVEVVGGNASDGNDTPDDAVRVQVNDGIGGTHRTSARHGLTDEDWYEIATVNEDVYDSTLSYSPTCEFTVCVTDTGGYNYPVALYPDKASATAGSPYLVTSNFGCLAATGVEGQKFYVHTIRGGLPLTTPRPYSISVNSDCDAPFMSAIPKMTGPVQLSSTTVSAGGTIDFTIPISLTTDRARIVLRRLDSVTSGSTLADLPGLLGSPFASGTLNVNASASGEYYLWVELRYPNTSDGAIYESDPLISDTHYHVDADKLDESGNRLGTVKYGGGYPLAKVTVTP